MLLPSGCAQLLVIPLNMAVANPDVRSLSAAQRTRMASMEVLRSPTTRPHTTLGTVNGLSCQRGIKRSCLPKATPLRVWSRGLSCLMQMPWLTQYVWWATALTGWTTVGLQLFAPVTQSNTKTREKRQD